MSGTTISDEQRWAVVRETAHGDPIALYVAMTATRSFNDVRHTLAHLPPGHVIVPASDVLTTELRRAIRLVIEAVTDSVLGRTALAESEVPAEAVALLQSVAEGDAR
jgi:hypothetical protein